MAEVIKSICVWPLLLTLLVLPARLPAHQLDEYLQATLVAIEPGAIRLQMNLTPGVAIAESVLGVIDQDRDGLISTNESAAYADLVKRDLVVRLDGSNLALNLASSYFPGTEELRTGWGFIQLEFSVTSGAFPIGVHKLTLENHHKPAASAYLSNAAKPGSSSIQITGQKRNDNQSLEEIAFDFHPPRDLSQTVTIVALLTAASGSLFAGWYRIRTKRNIRPSRNHAAVLTVPNSTFKSIV